VKSAGNVDDKAEASRTVQFALKAGPPAALPPVGSATGRVDLTWYASFIG
jgi:hypothetical protein